jgi:hypothetical protein
VRLEVVRDDGNTFRTHEFDNQRRLYAALGWETSSNTRLDVEYEHGIVQKSLVQPETIIDGVTPWINDGSHLSARKPAGKAGINLTLCPRTNFIPARSRGFGSEAA